MPIITPQQPDMQPVSASSNGYDNRSAEGKRPVLANLRTTDALRFVDEALDVLLVLPSEASLCSFSA